jgi:hypothetical protein
MISTAKHVQNTNCFGSLFRLNWLRTFTLARTTRWPHLIAVAVSLFCFSVAQADVLFSTSLRDAGGISRILDPSQVQIGLSYLGKGPNWHIFPNDPWTPSDLGSTRTVSASTDPNFNRFVSLLTDGIDEFVGLDERLHLMDGSTEGWGGVFNPESTTIRDWKGYKIDSISMRLDQLSIVSPGRNITKDGIWTDYSWIFTVSANGTAIPEPSTWALLLLGAVTLLGSCRRRRR